MRNIYECAVAIMQPKDIDHWCSDLYLKVTDESKALVSEYEFNNHVKTFIDAIDHVLWYEIPFAYTPYYSNREPR